MLVLFGFLTCLYYCQLCEDRVHVSLTILLLVFNTVSCIP